MTQAAILAASASPGTTTGFKNRIINGAMVLNQRGFSGAPATDAAYTLDRWQARWNVSGKYTVAQSSTAPAGFTNSMLLTSSSAYTSLLAGDYYFMAQPIEGYNTADLGWGTANAKTVTLSFWAQSSLTGSFGGNIGTYSGTRSYPFSYTISAANTWQQFSITIPGDTSGTWPTNNTGSIEVCFSMAMGSSNSGTANAWAAGFVGAPTGSVNLLGTSGATLYITGVQLEVGTTATNFDVRSYNQELYLCQRYYQTTAYVTGSGGNSTVYQGWISYGTPMRITNPTINLNTVLRITDGFASNPIQSSISFSANQYQNNLVYLQLNNFSGLTQGRFYGGYGQAQTDTFTLSAEL